jgi:hypothetical protein
VKISGVPDSPAGGLPMVQLNRYEWRIYHRSAKLTYPVASLAPDKN